MDEQASAPVSQPARRRPGLSCLLLLIAIPSILTLLAGAAAYYLISTLAKEAERVTWPKDLAQAVEQSLQLTPRVTVEGAIIVNEKTPVLELATVQEQVIHRYVWAQTWANSTKTIELEGTYRVKAGFDLRNQPFSLEVDPVTHTVRATFPPAKVLSVELIKYRILKDESGMWNWVSNADRQTALNLMLTSNRAELESSRIIEEATLSLEQHLKKIVAEKGGKFLENPSPTPQH